MKPSRDGIGILVASDVEQLQNLLQSFLSETQANSVALVDRTGRLLTHAGDSGSMDQVTFASLVAGDFAASDQLARLLGEQEFSSLYHAGEGRSMYLAAVAGWGILAALFDGGTTLGMVRLKSKAVLPRIAALFQDIAGRPEQSSLSLGMDNNWVSQAEDEIDRLFGE